MLMDARLKKKRKRRGKLRLPMKQARKTTSLNSTCTLSTKAHPTKILIPLPSKKTRRNSQLLPKPKEAKELRLRLRNLNRKE